MGYKIAQKKVDFSYPTATHFWYDFFSVRGWFFQKRPFFAIFLRLAEYGKSTFFLSFLIPAWPMSFFSRPLQRPHFLRFGSDFSQAFCALRNWYEVLALKTPMPGTFWQKSGWKIFEIFLIFATKRKMADFLTSPAPWRWGYCLRSHREKLG